MGLIAYSLRSERGEAHLSFRQVMRNEKAARPGSGAGG